MSLLKKIENEQLRHPPKVTSGDQVRVHVKIVEGDKERIQVFTGIVIKMRGTDVGATFTVRKISSGGVGVERIFPTHSPFISEIKIKRQGSVRRAKLYHIREKAAKEISRQMRNIRMAKEVEEVVSKAEAK